MSHIEDPEAMSRDAADWGLASLLMAGFLLLTGPIMLVFCLLFWVQPHGPNVIPQDEMRLAFWLALIVVGGAWLWCLLALIFGLKALRSARTYGQPCGLPAAGILVSLAAQLVWFIVGIDLVRILITFVRW